MGVSNQRADPRDERVSPPRVSSERSDRCGGASVVAASETAVVDNPDYRRGCSGGVPAIRHRKDVTMCTSEVRI